MKSKLLFIMLAVLCAIGARAEDSERMIVRAVVHEIQPGAQQAYEAVVKKYVSASNKLDTKNYFYATTQDLGNPNVYVYTALFPSFAAMELDPVDPIAKAYGTTEAARISKGIEGKMTSESVGTWVRRLDLSPKQPDNQPAASFIFTLSVGIRPDGIAQYEEALKKVAEATNAVAPELSYSAWSPAIGSTNAYVFRRTLQSYADLDNANSPVPVRLEKHFGKREAEKIMKTLNSVVVSVSSTLSRPRPELSYLPNS